jgi:hypothetical protein
MFTLTFWKATLERTIGTFAATVIGLAGTDTIGMLSLDWVQIFSASGIIAGLTALKCISVAASTDGSPSTTNTEKLADADAPKHLAG